MTKEIPRLFFLAAAVLLLFAPDLMCTEILTRQPLVVIDPGHDNKAPGLASGPGRREDRLAIELARNISERLSTACRVLMTRTPDAPPPENGRTAFANHKKADLYLSLHLHRDHSSQALIYYFNLPEAPDDNTWQSRAMQGQPASKKLAQSLGMAFKTAMADTKPGILSGPVLPLEGLSMPGLLVEPFAISQVPASSEERAAFIQNYARVLADTVMAFLSGKEAKP